MVNLEDCTVLVADEDGDFRRALVADLAALGAHTLEAADGISAWRAIGSSAPALAVLDLLLPAIDGLELLARARARELPIAIAVTCAEHGRLGHVSLRAARKLGAHATLLKPFRARALLDELGAEPGLPSPARRALRPRVRPAVASPAPFSRERAGADDAGCG